MTRKHRLRVLAVWVVLGLVFCLGLQYLAATDLQRRHARPVSPIGTETTVMRLLQIPHLSGDCVFMGSSLTERMPITQNVGVIGVPGSSFTAACILLDEQHVSFPAGTTYILEINNMFNGNYEDVIKETRKWKFKQFADSKFFSIAARPVNQILSYLCLFVEGSAQAYDERESFDVPVAQPEELHEEEPTADELAEWHEILEWMQKLRNGGGKLCLVCYPARDLKRYEKSYLRAKKLAAYAGVPVLNYNKPEWLPKLLYTDNRHMKLSAPQTMKFRNTVVRDAKACAR